MENAFKMLEVTMEMSLSPLHLQRLRHGIENTLNALLMRFQPLLNGVLISYRGVELCGGATGGFATETAQITFTIRFEALVFQVQRGDAIVGTVNKVGADHIGLLVFGIFNAAIAVDQMPPSSRYDASGGGASAAAAAAAEADAVPSSSSPTPTREALWRLPAGTLGEGSSDVLRLGSRVSFVVVGMHSEDGVVSIAGALRDASSRSRSASMASLGGAESGEDSNALTRSSSGGGGGGGGGDQQRPAKRRRSASGDDASSDAKRARSSSAGSSGSVPSLASATATAAAAATATVTATAAAADSDSDSRSSSNDAKPPPAAAAAAAAAASDKQPAAAAQPQPAPPPAQMTAAEKTQKKQSKKAKRRASQKARRAKGL